MPLPLAAEDDEAPELLANDPIGRPKFACTVPNLLSPVLPPDACFDATDVYAGPRAVIDGLAGSDAFPESYKAEPDTPASNGVDVLSASASGRGVSGGFTSVLMSDNASLAISKPVADDDRGKADETRGWGADRLEEPLAWTLRMLDIED